MKKYLIFAFALLLSGCLSPVTTDSMGSAYLIRATPSNVPVSSQNSGVVLVMPPNTTTVYNTRGMAYSTSPYQISYYAKNRWAETPSEMLQPLITKTLQKTHRFRAVVNAPYPGRYNYLLTTEITELLQDYTGCTPVLKFGLRAQYNNGVTGQIIRIKEINRSIPMRKKDPYAGVIAANQAVAEVLEELAEFVI